MIAIPSPSFEEEAVSLHISAFLDGHGIHHKRLYNNIIALNRHYDAAKPGLMLCAHIDTVSPCEGYTFDPYNPPRHPEQLSSGQIPHQVRDDSAVRHPEQQTSHPELVSGSDYNIIYGLGSNDDGASVVAMIAAFRHFYDKTLPFNLILVLSAEEERSGSRGMQAVWSAFGSGELSRLFGAEVKAPQHAIVGEPTGMRAAIAERGLLVVDAEAEGVSGHAARDEGVNALYIALGDIDTLRRTTFDRKSPLMGEIKLTVTQIHAGTVHNVVPDRCKFVIDIRPTEQYSNEELLRLLQARCQSRLTARKLSNRSSATAADSPLLRCAAACGMETFVSPTSSDWMRIDCDALKMGPGDSARSHRADEYVTEAEIEEGIEKYIEFIQTYGNTLE